MTRSVPSVHTNVHTSRYSCNHVRFPVARHDYSYRIRNIDIHTYTYMLGDIVEIYTHLRKGARIGTGSRHSSTSPPVIDRLDDGPHVKSTRGCNPMMDSMEKLPASGCNGRTWPHAVQTGVSNAQRLHTGHSVGSKFGPLRWTRREALPRRGTVACPSRSP